MIGETLDVIQGIVDQLFDEKIRHARCDPWRGYDPDDVPRLVAHRLAELEAARDELCTRALQRDWAEFSGSRLCRRSLREWIDDAIEETINNLDLRDDRDPAGGDDPCPDDDTFAEIGPGGIHIDCLDGLSYWSEQ